MSVCVSVPRFLEWRMLSWHARQRLHCVCVWERETEREEESESERES